MSGHSKWSTIKRQKGAADVKRGLVFTKLSNAITLAVRNGGGVGDPESNFKLRLIVESARSMNMPKENIERAIQRAVGKSAEHVEEVVYEGFGPGGFSVIVEAITDNKMRTTPIVKNIFEKNGGSMGIPGAVSYQFQQRGLIILQKNGKSLDEIFLIAAEGGAEDVEEGDIEEVFVTTKVEDLAKVKDVLEKEGYTLTSAELTRRPVVFMPLSDSEATTRAITFLEKLDDLDDVQKVYANYEVAGGA